VMLSKATPRHGMLQGIGPAVKVEYGFDRRTDALVLAKGGVGASRLNALQAPGPPRHTPVARHRSFCPALKEESSSLTYNANALHRIGMTAQGADDGQDG
jgi:hypothetical protein